jgi:hypothetical protein
VRSLQRCIPALSRGFVAKELAYLESLRLRELLGTEKYVELAATHQAIVPDKIPEMRAVFELLPVAGCRLAPPVETD